MRQEPWKSWLGQSPLKNQREIVSNGEQTRLELESEMVRYVKQELGPASEYLRLLLLLMFVPLLTIVVFLSSLMVVVGMWVMWLSHWVLAPLRLWLVRYYPARKKRRVKL